MSNPLDLLNKFIGAIIAYGPKNKTKKARMARKAARRKKFGNETRLADYIFGGSRDEADAVSRFQRLLAAPHSMKRIFSCVAVLDYMYGSK